MDSQKSMQYVVDFFPPSITWAFILYRLVFFKQFRGRGADVIHHTCWLMQNVVPVEHRAFVCQGFMLCTDTCPCSSLGRAIQQNANHDKTGKNIQILFVFLIGGYRNNDNSFLSTMDKGKVEGKEKKLSLCIEPSNPMRQQAH